MPTLAPLDRPRLLPREFDEAELDAGVVTPRVTALNVVVDEGVGVTLLVVEEVEVGEVGFRWRRNLGLWIHPLPRVSRRWILKRGWMFRSFEVLIVHI